MKTLTNHLIITALFLTLVLSAVPVFAQTNETTETDTTAVTETDGRPTPEERQENLQERQAEREEAVSERQAQVEQKRADAEATIAERKEEFQATQEERREALSERVKERITNLAANVSNRLDAAVERMQNIIDRLNTRIEKLKDRGLDTSEAERHMNNAQDAVDAAIALLENIDQVVNDAVTAEDPRSAWQTAKTEFLSIKESIKSAHSSLREAVAALKTAAQEMREENTSDEAGTDETSSDSE